MCGMFAVWANVLYTVKYIRFMMLKGSRAAYGNSGRNLAAIWANININVE